MTMSFYASDLFAIHKAVVAYMRMANEAESCGIVLGSVEVMDANGTPLGLISLNNDKAVFTAVAAS